MSYYHTPGYKTNLTTAKTTFIIWGKYKGNKNNIPKITSVDGAKFSQGSNHLYLRDIDTDLLKKQQTLKGIENASFDVKTKDEISESLVKGCESLTMPDANFNVRHYDNGLNIGENGGGTFVAWGEMLDGMMSKVSGRFMSYDGKEFTVENAFKSAKEGTKRGKFYDIRTKETNAIRFDKDIEECMKKLLGLNIQPPPVSDDDDDQSVQSVNPYGLNLIDDGSIYSFSDNPIRNNTDVIVGQTQLGGIQLKYFMKGMKHKFENNSPFHHTNDFNSDNQKKFLPEKEYEEKAFIERLVQLETEIINHNSENFNKTYQNFQFNDDSHPDKIDYYINEEGNSEFESPHKNVLVYDYYREKAVIIFYKKDNTIYYRITSSNIYYGKPKEKNNYSYRVTLKDNLYQSDIEDGFLYLPQKQTVDVDVFSENNDQFKSVSDLTTDIKSFSIEPVFSYVIHNRKIKYNVSYFRIDRSNLDKSVEDRTYLIDFDKYIKGVHSHQIRYINNKDIKLEIKKEVRYRNDGYIGNIVDKSDDTNIIMPYYQGGSNIRKRKTKHKRKRKNATLKK